MDFSAAGPARSARDRVPPAAVARGNAVYLHQLYRETSPPPPPPPPPPPLLIRRELMLFCWILKWVLVVFLLTASISLVIWMIFHPTFPQLNVVSASISNVSISAAPAAECNITLLLTNPNRHLTAAYDLMKISLLYASQEVLLSQFHQPPIVQPKRTRLTLQTDLSFSGVNLSSSVVSTMKQDLDSGSLGLVIKVSSVVKFRNGKWKTKSHFMRAYCDGVSFAFTSSDKPGIFLNPYQECEVYVYTK